ncbi:MAG TPA: glycosyltransferase [Longimicrobium sp.]|nr:glycosyltransferase [Longimicrobium sp.]
MKIAVHVSGAAIRGNERQTARVVEGLVARGHVVIASCPAGSPAEAELLRAGARTTGIRPRGDADLWHALRFASWLKRERPDALLLTSWKRAFIAGWAARRAKVPRVVLRVGGLHRIGAGVGDWKHRRALTSYVDAIVVNSREIERRLRTSLPDLPPERVRTVLNGARLRRAAPAPLRAELGIGAQALLVAGVGGLERRKGFDLLLRALADGPGDAHAVIAGEGPLRAELTEMAAELGVGGRVHLLGERKDVSAVLAAADVFALPSRAEGMSVAMLEAMAAERPVIAADVGGVWEALAARDGRPAAGWIVPREDSVALAAALREVGDKLRAGDGDVAARVAEARWRLDHWFTVDAMVEGMEAVLRG